MALGVCKHPYYSIICPLEARFLICEMIGLARRSPRLSAHDFYLNPKDSCYKFYTCPTPPPVAPGARTILPALGAASISPQLSPGLESTSLPRTLTSSWGRPCLATGHARHTDMVPHPECGNSEDHCSSRAPRAAGGGLCGDCIEAQLPPAQARLLPFPSTAAELPAR